MNQEDKDKEQKNLKSAVGYLTESLDFIKLQVLEAKEIRGFCIILDYIGERDERVQKVAYRAVDSLQMIGVLEVLKDDLINDYRSIDDEDEDEQ